MKLCLLLFGLTVTVLFAACNANQPSSQARCYKLQNQSSSTVSLDFSYNGYVPTGAPTHIDFIPGGNYPASGDWCWVSPDGYYATVRFSGNVTPSWDGNLTMGNGALGYPSGTYIFRNPQNGLRTADSSACIPNQYPGNDQFCLVDAGQAITIGCPFGSVARTGSFSAVQNMKIQCNNGRKWTITCIDGGRTCNFNSREICEGLSTWNVGMHCTENGATPNGFE